MDSQEYFIEPPTQSAKLPYLQIVRVPKGGFIHVQVLSTAVTGILIHRVGKKPFLCPGTTCTAEGCPNTGRYEGYLECLSPAYKKRIMLAFSSEVANVLKCLAVENGLSLRGMNLLLSREGSAANSPINVEYKGRPRDLHGLPPERDLKPFIVRLFTRRNQISNGGSTNVNP